MKLRDLKSDDDVRGLARRSLGTAYAEFFSEEVIERAVDSWYAPAELEGYLEDDHMTFVVAEDHGHVVGFGQANVVEDVGKGRILWVHVDPDRRGEGVGSAILDALLDRLHDRGIQTTTAVMLADHDEGIAFFTGHGFERLADREVQIGGEQFRELILREGTSPSTPLLLYVDEDGEEYFVDTDESERGSVGPFSAVYRDPDRMHRFGWFCAVCESVETVMDTMGRIRCANCDNARKPTRWDAAYL